MIESSNGRVGEKGTRQGKWEGCRIQSTNSETKTGEWHKNGGVG